MKKMPKVKKARNVVKTKKSRKVTKKKAVKKRSPRLIIFTIGFIFLMCMGVIAYKTFTSQPHSVVENPQTEMKKLPKKIADQLSQAPAAATLRVPILMYHYVEFVQDKSDTMRQLLDIEPPVFEAQMQTLKQAGYTFITAKELGEAIDGKLQLPKNPIVITFDDGHWDLDTVVLPILKKYNIKATAYIIPGFTGGSDFMSEAQIRDVIKSKLVEIGDHTVHHIALKDTSLATDEYEVGESKKMLEDTYHIKVVSFAYPNGEFDEQSVQVVKQDGFSTAVSTIPGIAQDQNNRFFLYRLRPGDRVGEELLSYLSSNAYQAY